MSSLPTLTSSDMAVGNEFSAHSEPESFPNTALFQRVVDLANQSRLSLKAIIKDWDLDIEANHADVLADVLRLRSVILKSMPPATLKALADSQDVFFCLAAPPGYEWLVGYLVIMSIGAAVVPLSAKVLNEELEWFITTTNASAVLLSQSVLPSECSTSLSSKLRMDCQLVRIPSYTGKRPESHASEFRLSTATLNPKAVGYVMFTSGTSGRPKGVLHSRGAFISTLFETREMLSMTEDDVGLFHITPHRMRGLSGQIMFLISGGRVEFAYGLWSPKWMWQQLQTGRITCSLDRAGDFRALIDYYEEHIAKLGPEEVESFTIGLRAFRLPLIGGFPVTRSIWDQWNRIPGSHCLINDYGSTETFNMLCSFPADKASATNYVGGPWPGVDVKLSNGDSGELLARTRDMFIGYLNQPELTANAFDCNGWYRTKDYVQKEGLGYLFKGRMSVDVIRHKGWLVSGVELEDTISRFAYVKEVMVVPVAHDLFGECVGVIIRPCVNVLPQALSLAFLRSELYNAMGLPEYKLPTVLHLLDTDNPLPTTPAGKPDKKRAVGLYFPANYQSVFPGIVEVWNARKAVKQDSSREKDERSCMHPVKRAWDWEGLAA